MINTLLIPTSAWVLNPAGLLQEERSNPIIPASTKPNISLMMAWNQNEFPIVHIVSILFMFLSLFILFCKIQ